MSSPILYSFRRCPYAMRARLALKYAGVRVELREILLRDKPAGMLMASPKGTVPVLHLADGSDPDGWLAQEESANKLIAINDGPFKQLLDRYKYADRHPEKSREAWRDEAVALHIAPLDTRLRESRFLLGEKVSLADMALMPFVRQFALVDAAWFESEVETAAPFPALRDWLQRLIDAELFAAVMHKLPVWQAGDSPTFF
jgi:glutathione S-transferase